MRLGALEESVSLYCQALLIRPELGGFHPANKAVLTKQLSDKLNLFKASITASGVLYSIDINALTQSIEKVKDVGDDRHTIIHGLLSRNADGEFAFHNKGRDIKATLDGLRGLTQRCHEAGLELTTHFLGFYTELVSRKSLHPEIEKHFIVSLHAHLKLQVSFNAAREESLQSPELEAQFLKTGSIEKASHT